MVNGNFFLTTMENWQLEGDHRLKPFLLQGLLVKAVISKEKQETCQTKFYCDAPFLDIEGKQINSLMTSSLACDWCHRGEGVGNLWHPSNRAGPGQDQDIQYKL